MHYLSFRSFAGLVLALPMVVSFEVETRDSDVFNYIDPLIGTINGG